MTSRNDRPTRGGTSWATASRLCALTLAGLLATTGLLSADDALTGTAGDSEAARRASLKESASSTKGVLSGLAERASDDSGAPPIVTYIPTRGRGGAMNKAGAGTRSRGSQATVEALAPHDHVALTTQKQPTLYWFVSEATEQRIEFTLNDETSIEPLIELTMPGPITPGIHALDLAKHDISLSPGEVYTWNVALVVDEERRSADRIGMGLMEWTEVSPELAASLADAKWSYAPYALSGVWYDAVDELLAALEKDPDNERLRLQRSTFLEQAELGRVALHALHSKD